MKGREEDEPPVPLLFGAAKLSFPEAPQPTTSGVALLSPSEWEGDVLSTNALIAAQSPFSDADLTSQSA